MSMNRRAHLVVAAAVLSAAVTAVPADAKATLVARSAGTVEAYEFIYSTYSYGYSLTGSVSFGNRTFDGTASGGYGVYCCDGSVPEPFALHGSSPDGDLDATCTDHVGLYMGTPTAGYLQCTGHIGDGGTTTTRLVIALPVAQENPTQHGSSYGYSGAFAG
jgi:hypothetical protein